MTKVVQNRKLYFSMFFYKIIVALLFIYSGSITYLYVNKKSVSSEYYKKQTKEIVDTFSSKTNDVNVSNQIDNFAIGGERTLPGGGGAWCVYKKINDKWNRLFCSQDSTWCGLYKKYRLPVGLLGECVLEPNKNVLNLD